MSGASPGTPLYEIIYGVLREHIVDGRFPAGLVLGEAAVARAFQASRIPAAMALRRLKEDGLLAEFAGRGYLAGPDRAGEPVRLDLFAAGLQVPADLRTARNAQSARHRMYSEVEHAVAACLAYGRFLLNESALAEHYGVSRTIAHEVLAQLERTGIITQDRNRRWYAGPLTRELLREHYEIRWLLEPLALADLAVALDPADLRARERRARRGADGRLPPGELEVLERDLHVDIVLHCRNGQLREAIRRSQLPLIATHSAFAHVRHREEVVTMVAEHRAIFDFLLKGERESAIDGLRRHLRRSLDPNLDLLARLGPLPEALRLPYLVPA